MLLESLAPAQGRKFTCFPSLQEKCHFRGFCLSEIFQPLHQDNSCQAFCVHTWLADLDPFKEVTGEFEKNIMKVVFCPV